MKKDKKYKEKYKQLKHQVQKEQRHAYNTYIEKLILDLPTNVLLIDFVRLFLNKFYISFTVLFASLFMFIIFLSVSSKSDLMLSQFALSYLRIFLGC
jgi:hypothetical protein